jgi:hypothetical protein
LGIEPIGLLDTSILSKRTGRDDMLENILFAMLRAKRFTNGSREGRFPENWLRFNHKYFKLGLFKSHMGNLPEKLLRET